MASTPTRKGRNRVIAVMELKYDFLHMKQARNSRCTFESARRLAQVGTATRVLRARQRHLLEKTWKPYRNLKAVVRTQGEDSHSFTTSCNISIQAAVAQLPSEVLQNNHGVKSQVVTSSLQTLSEGLQRMESNLKMRPVRKSPPRNHDEDLLLFRYAAIPKVQRDALGKTLNKPPARLGKKKSLEMWKWVREEEVNKMPQHITSFPPPQKLLTKSQGNRLKMTAQVLKVKEVQTPSALTFRC
ncbi:hypothetical protein Nmel_001002 [Mimus melanotis]